MSDRVDRLIERVLCPRAGAFRPEVGLDAVARETRFSAQAQDRQQTQRPLLPRGDGDRAAACLAEAERLHKAIEEQAWAGDWYLRAWFDDGTPLGSHVNDECRIDSLPQSWAVLSGAGDRERSRRGIDFLSLWWRCWWRAGVAQRMLRPR